MANFVKRPGVIGGGQSKGYGLAHYAAESKSKKEEESIEGLCGEEESLALKEIKKCEKCGEEIRADEKGLCADCSK